MEAWQFGSALMAIVVIDLVLAGDNAIVIALAARGLRPALARRAILWGAVGAVAVRSTMTLVVVWLLKVPGLLLAGGLALVWIAWRLLQPQPEQASTGTVAATGFWGALRTIVVADAVMGLDNVLAVAGAAQGSYLLVVLGLAISVPIVVWGSTLALMLVQRWPAVVYLGGGVLLWTAAQMITREPWLAAAITRQPALATAAHALVPLVLAAAFLHRQRMVARRVRQRLHELAARRPTSGGPVPTPTEELKMLNVLVPVDGSPHSLKAVRHAVSEYDRHHALRLQLLNVQSPLSRHAARWLSRGLREDWHREQAERAMAPARRWLERAGVPHEVHFAVGRHADEICRAAERLQCHHIVIGTARRMSLTRLLQDSVTDAVLQQSSVPVEVVASGEVSALERWGVRAGVGAGLGGLLMLIVD